MISDRCSETMHVMHVESEMAAADCSALIHMTATSEIERYIHLLHHNEVQAVQNPLCRNCDILLQLCLR